MMLARDIPKPETYGVPTVYAAGDVNRDGVCDGYDPQDWDDYNDYGAGALAADLDVNRDGVVDSADRALVQGHADWALWTSHGRGSVSRLHNRRGYAGYEYDPATSQWHVRHRVLVSEMGRWNRRDPLGYVDGMSVYEYVGSIPMVATDPMGLNTSAKLGEGPDDSGGFVVSQATPLVPIAVGPGTARTTQLIGATAACIQCGSNTNMPKRGTTWTAPPPITIKIKTPGWFPRYIELQYIPSCRLTTTDQLQALVPAQTANGLVFLWINCDRAA
ncbi:MAG: hypothetical protein KF864_06585 [Phycisphaeraceae bacterium]|nr:hypothetical protein [Phycisphaeraceae bacterium]